MKIPSLLKKFRLLLSFLLILGLHLPAFALPPEQPYYSDCAQPWEKPDDSASNFEKRGWFKVANSYVNCLYNYQEEARSNANQFLDALNDLVTETNEKINRNEITDDAYEEAKRTFDRYEDAVKAWAQVIEDTQKEKESFARRNGMELE